MGLRGLKTICTALGLASALVAYANYAIAAHYSAGSSGPKDTLAVAIIFALAPLAVLPAERGRAFWNRFVAIPVAAVVGAPTAAAGAYLLAIDPSDLILRAWPMLYGMVLMALAILIWKLG